MFSISIGIYSSIKLSQGAESNSSNTVLLLGDDTENMSIMLEYTCIWTATTVPENSVLF